MVNALGLGSSLPKVGRGSSPLFGNLLNSDCIAQSGRALNF